MMIDSLPGFPDGVSLAEDGNFWITLAGPNQPFVKLLPYRSAHPNISSVQHALDLPDCYVVLSVGMDQPVSPSGHLKPRKARQGAKRTFSIIK